MGLNVYFLYLEKKNDWEFVNQYWNKNVLHYIWPLFDFSLVALIRYLANVTKVSDVVPIIILRFCSVSLPRIDNMPHDYLLCLSLAVRVAPLRKIEVLSELLRVASWKRTADLFIFFVFLWQMDHNRGFLKRCLFFW